MSHSVRIEDFNSICRICLISKNDMITFFSPMVIYMLEQCTSVQEVLQKELPQQLCIDCYGHLKNAFHFKQQYLLSVQILKQIILQSEKCVKEEINENEIMVVESNIKEEKENENTDSKNINKCEFINANETAVVKTNIKEETETENTISLNDEESNLDAANEADGDNEACNEEDNDTDSSTDEVFRKIEEKMARNKSQHTIKANMEVICDICGKKFKRKYFLRHRKCHTDNRPYECDICHFKFKRLYTLNNHKERVHEAKKISRKEMCYICGKFINSTLSVHLETHKELNENDHFKCNICNRSYKRSINLQIHVRLKHSENKVKSYSCKVCNKTFVCKGYLNTHIRFNHSGHKKDHVCTYCNKKYYTKSHLNGHIRTAHMDVRPHSCTVCKKGFYTKVILDNHMRTHTGERPYSCNVCGKSFGFKVVLTTHMKVHSKTK